MARFGTTLLIERHSATASFRQGLPEPSDHGWFEVLYLPVIWIPAIPAGMTAVFDEVDSVLDELNEALAA